MKKIYGFTLAEVAIVVGLIFLTALLMVPNLVEDNKKIDIIAKWKNTYQNIEYIFSAMTAQTSETDNAEFQKASGNDEKADLLFEMLAPYFRVDKAISNEEYQTYYLNGSKVKENDDYYTKNLHILNSGKILGLKWLNTPESVTDKMPIAILSIDLNGLNKPNKWGYDIFGVNIYTNRIEPLGKTNDDYLIKTDCSKKGTGVACSYFYYIYGGEFN